MTHNTVADMPRRGRRLPPGASACGRRASRWRWRWPLPGDRPTPVPLTPTPTPLSPIGRPKPERLVEMIEGDPVDSWPLPGQAARLWA